MDTVLCKRFFDGETVMDAFKGVAQDISQALFDGVILDAYTPPLTVHHKNPIVILSDEDPDFFIELRFELDDAATSSFVDAWISSRFTASWLCYARASSGVNVNRLIDRDWHYVQSMPA